MNKFNLVADFSPAGDQGQAIDELAAGVEKGLAAQTLLGVTGSGKTYTMAQVIAKCNRPALIIAHNKTLAAQLYGEFKEFFPENAVEYFVSYYDYYQPEAYVPHSDIYIEKEAQINEEIEKLRHSATCSLFERRDVIVVASVSCIYGLGSPEDYRSETLSLREGQIYDRDEVLRKLVDIQYERNDYDFRRGTFRVRGDVIEIIPVAASEKAIRVEFFGDEVERIREIDVLTGEVLGTLKHTSIFPATHYIVAPEYMEVALRRIEDELEERLELLRANEKLLEAQRLEQRTRFDLEMIREIGFCSGIENYSRHLTGREEGERPFTLLDYFPEDMLVFIDESHVSVPQIGGMYEGDRSRKLKLIEHGFRLPSALDNRPLSFAEFEKIVEQVVYVSATPAEYEKRRSGRITEQIIRPTGLVDPEIFVRPIKGQIDDLRDEIELCLERDERVLITTLTKRMAEDLASFYRDTGLNVRYLHSEITTLERMEILRDLRLGTFDVLVGINLLREGLDLPEVSLVAILDADKEGFLRSETSLIQTVGRAARNVNGKVIMYADVITGSMERAIKETERRRTLQIEYNQKHSISPQSIRKGIRELIEATQTAEKEADYGHSYSGLKKGKLSPKQLQKELAIMEKEMQKAARELRFEEAALLRDLIIELKGKVNSKEN